MRHPTLSILCKTRRSCKLSYIGKTVRKLFQVDLPLEGLKALYSCLYNSVINAQRS